MIYGMKESAMDRNKRALINQNRWWDTGHVPDSQLRTYRRRDFFILMEKLSDEKILIIPGPRRAGKTTIMFQMIDELITSEEVNPKNILYLSFDYPYLISDLDRPFEDILRIYSEMILKESMDNLTNRTYLFLDEVYSLPNWGKILKGHYDRKTNTKIIASGSSSPQIMEEAAKALIGRIDKHLMLPMKFVDVASYYMKKHSKEIKEISLEVLRNGFRKSIETGKISHLQKAYSAGFDSLAGLEDEFQGQLIEYLIKDGYPETLDQPDYSRTANSISTAIDLSIYKDVMRIFRGREPQAIARLVSLLAQSSGNIASLRFLAQALGIDERTVEKYLWHLESVYLISTSYSYSGSLYRSLPRARKIYISNSGVRNAVLGMLSDRLKEDPTELGRCAEIVALDHIKRLGFCLEPSKESQSFYWRNGRGDEVDIIQGIMGSVIPFDVRFRESIDETDLKALNRFLDEYPKCKWGVLLTKRDLGMEDNVMMIPLWLFLLTC